MQVQGGGPREELLDYLPPKKCNQDHPQSIGSKTCGGRRKESVLGGWSGRSQAAQSVSCEGCEEQIRAAPEAGSEESRAG